MAKKRRSKKDSSLIQVYGAIAIVFSLIVLLHGNTGFLGKFFFQCSRYLLGDFYYIFYILFIVTGLYLVFKKRLPLVDTRKLIGLFLILFTVQMVLSIPKTGETGKLALDLFFNNSESIFSGDYPAGGGAIAAAVYSGISYLVSRVGAIIVTVVMAILGVVLVIDLDSARETVRSLVETSKESAQQRKKDNQNRKPITLKKPELSFKKNDRKKTENFEDKIISHSDNITEGITVIEDETPVTVAPVKPAATANKPEEIRQPAKQEVTGDVSTDSAGYAEFKNYKLPRLSLLETVSNAKSSANKNNAAAKANQLIEILEQFDVPCTLQEIHIGPSVTKFEVKPESGIKVSRITSLQENIKMELAVKDVRIEAPVPGKNAVGIEIPNVERSSVRMSELLKNVPDKYHDSKLLIALGKDLSGENVYAEINRLPHMLIAGSTGSGKSVCINSIITTLLLRTTPNDVKLLLIDPKKVEFTPYDGIPNLIGPVITDTADAATALKTIVSIMDNRYETFHKVGVRDIKDYNKKAANDPDLPHMVNIVVIIDELADLMITHGKEVEASIQRITQLARASGIHLIVATQRPSTDVITGTIKTNIPSRIAFAVASAIDSRIILDQVGAERLLGNGDMLYIPMGESVPRRIQGVYVSDDEIRNITDYVRSVAKPQYDKAFVATEMSGESNYANSSSVDPLYNEVKKFVATTGKASTSSIQRYFGFGYNRAARIIDMLEEEGAVGPVNGSKPREVFIKPEDFE